ncbi:divergent polysaccharide deacetylase family protein [Nitrospirillum sp. BR 11164]|uniref:divergent polysaccharide deacetylase family protein n=1 Tax=Nitrospirillum sp. BR 11164 TaxID=3104324 RepID=UPI002AFFDC2B|nr:divergent polysaccharide deacetylase family protein [Nitrospirillum sp. BR 11164]MEA1651598.1 divergent polysaccharide deacetylase family protein [Nitrospirillum sp. BR 11164]
MAALPTRLKALVSRPPRKTKPAKAAKTTKREKGGDDDAFEALLAGADEDASADVLAARLGVPKRAGRAGAATTTEHARDGTDKPRRRLNLFAVAVALTVVAVAGTVAWLAATAEETAAARRKATTLADIPVTLPQGGARPVEAPHAAAPAAEGAAKPAAAHDPDPMDVAVKLAPSRNEDLLEKTRAGYLPRMPAKGPAPWQAYSRPFPQDDTRPRIALVMADLGWSPSALEKVLARMPAAVTLAFAAGAPNLQKAVDQARGDGHEVLLQVPMEPQGFPLNDPGPGTLLTSLSDEKNVDRLETAMASATGYVGLTNLTGTKFLASHDSLQTVLRQVQRRGLIYVDSWPTTSSQATRIATQLGLPRAVSDVQVDRSPSDAGVAAQLAELERLAKLNGVAVGYAQPYPVTLEGIARWAVGLRDRGIVLAPVTAVVNRQADR